MERNGVKNNQPKASVGLASDVVTKRLDKLEISAPRKDMRLQIDKTQSSKTIHKSPKETIAMFAVTKL